MDTSNGENPPRATFAIINLNYLILEFLSKYAFDKHLFCFSVAKVCKLF